LTVPTLSERLDAPRLSRFHVRLLLVAGLGWMNDALDILIVGAIVAAVARNWGLDAGTAQWINSANSPASSSARWPPAGRPRSGASGRSWHR
jgi:hypothetical protein